MDRPSRGRPTEPLRRDEVSSTSPFARGKYELSSPLGGRDDTLEASELLRTLEPTVLRAVLRGGLTPLGVCMFRAGL